MTHASRDSEILPPEQCFILFTRFLFSWRNSPNFFYSRN